MRRSSFFLALAACVTAALLGASQAKAVTIIVHSDSGSLSTFTAVNAGTVGVGVGAVTTLDITLTTPAKETLATVNGSTTGNPINPLPMLASFTTTEIVKLTNLGSFAGTTVYSTTSIDYVKTFGPGTGVGVAQLTYNLSNGGSAFDGTLNLAGFVTKLVTNKLSGYDFGLFSISPTGANNLTLTGEQYTGGVTTVAGVIATTGASVTGSGAYSESTSAVPEPTSMALLGIGMAGFFTYRRLFKRVATA